MNVPEGQLVFCSEDISHVLNQGGIYLVCIVATITFCQEVYQKLIRFCQQVHQLDVF